MAQPILAWAAVVLAATTSTGILVTRDWRWNMGFAAMQYLCAAILASAHWPLGMAAALLVSGWMSVAALGMTLTALPPPLESAEMFWPQGRAFRLFMAGMIIILAAGIAPRTEAFIPGIQPAVATGSILLVGIGCLQLGTSSQIARIILGLLTVLTGFEVFYSSVESSILVAGMLSVVVLGLGLVGSYLLNAAVAEDAA